MAGSKLNLTCVPVLEKNKVLWREKCPLCLIPKILPCFHTFCVDCIDFLADTWPMVLEEESDPSGPKKFPCPICRKYADVPEAGVDGFEGNLYILDEEEYTPRSALGRKICCLVCTNHNTVTSACKLCDLLMCQHCAYFHGVFVGSKDHTLYPLNIDQMFPIDTTGSDDSWVKDGTIDDVYNYSVVSESVYEIYDDPEETRRPPPPPLPTSQYANLSKTSPPPPPPSQTECTILDNTQPPPTRPPAPAPIPPVPPLPPKPSRPPVSKPPSTQAPPPPTHPPPLSSGHPKGQSALPVRPTGPAAARPKPSPIQKLHDAYFASEIHDVYYLEATSPRPLAEKAESDDDDYVDYEEPDDYSLGTTRSPSPVRNSCLSFLPQVNIDGAKSPAPGRRQLKSNRSSILPDPSKWSLKWPSARVRLFSVSSAITVIFGKGVEKRNKLGLFEPDGKKIFKTPIVQEMTTMALLDDSRQTRLVFSLKDSQELRWLRTDKPQEQSLVRHISLKDLTLSKPVTGSQVYVVGTNEHGHHQIHRLLVNRSTPPYRLDHTGTILAFDVSSNGEFFAVLSREDDLTVDVYKKHHHKCSHVAGFTFDDKKGSGDVCFYVPKGLTREIGEVLVVADHNKSRLLLLDYEADCRILETVEVTSPVFLTKDASGKLWMACNSTAEKSEVFFF